METRRTALLVGIVTVAAVALVIGATTATNHKSPDPAWNETYGVNGSEAAADVITSDDGGYVFAGTRSWQVQLNATEPPEAGYREIDDPIGPNKTYRKTFQEAWLVETDEDGDERWNRSYGGNNRSTSAVSVTETSDGGYLLAGTAKRYPVSTPGNGGWLAKVDADGNEEWNRTYAQGQFGLATFSAATEVPAGGYVAVGSNNVYSEIRTDLWVVRVDENGNELWNKSIGTADGADGANDVIATSDGNIAVVGATRSLDAYATQDTGQLLVLEPDGTELVNRTFGGSQEDRPVALVEHDGGFTVAGHTTTDTRGETNRQVWLVRFATNGTKVWENRYGRNGTEGNQLDDTASDIAVAPNGGYLVVGQREPPERISALGPTQRMLLRVVANGTQLWNYGVGGEGRDVAAAVTAGGDDRFVVAHDVLVGESSSDAALTAYDAPATLSAPSDRVTPTPGGSGTATPGGTNGSSSAATPTPGSTSGNGSAGTATPAATENGTAAENESDAATGTETPSASGPGFGVLAAVLAVLSVVLGARRRA